MIRKTAKQTERTNESEALTAPTARETSRVVLPSVWGDPWGLMRDFDRHFDEMRRLFEDDFFRSSAALVRAPTGGGAYPAFARARADLVDAGKEYVMTAELPGFTKDQVAVEVTAAGVEVSATVSEEKSEGTEEKGYLARERSVRSLRRSFEFPEDVNPDQAAAELKDGVLTVRVPKTNPVEPKKAKVPVK